MKKAIISAIVNYAEELKSAGRELLKRKKMLGLEF